MEVLEPAALTSEIQRFQLWATNLGLFYQDYSSFDYRLRDNEIVRSFARELLVKLTEALDKVSVKSKPQTLHCGYMRKVNHLQAWSLI